MPSDPLGGMLDQWSDVHEDDFRWVTNLLSRFTYKPGWVFDLSRRPEKGGPLLTVTFQAEDSRKGPNQWPTYRMVGESLSIERDDLVPLTGQFVVDRYLLKERSEHLFWEWLRRTISFVEKHEQDEWFRVDGQLPYDPHISEGRFRR
jgi:hypothetical protein